MYYIILYYFIFYVILPYYILLYILYYFFIDIICIMHLRANAYCLAVRSHIDIPTLRSHSRIKDGTMRTAGERPKAIQQPVTFHS